MKTEINGQFFVFSIKFQDTPLVLKLLDVSRQVDEVNLAYSVQLWVICKPENSPARISGVYHKHNFICYGNQFDGHFCLINCNSIALTMFYDHLNKVMISDTCK